MAAKVIFTCAEINAACAAALAADKPLSTVFTIGTTARPGANGTKWFDLSATLRDASGAVVKNRQSVYRLFQADSNW